MADRKAELERKKLKLEQMRKEREEKNRQRKVKEVKICSQWSYKVTFVPCISFPGDVLIVAFIMLISIFQYFKIEFSQFYNT